MAIEIQTQVPVKIYAGDYIQWLTQEDSDRSIADGWVMSYAFVTAAGSFEVVCSDNGDNNHLASISMAISNSLIVGDYKWQSYIAKDTERYFVDEGSLTVEPNFSSLDGGYDARSFWKTVLDNVEAVIKGRATKDQSSYTVNGRQLSRTPVADLLLLYNQAKTNVRGEEQAEKQRNGLGGSTNIYVRF